MARRIEHLRTAPFVFVLLLLLGALLPAQGAWSNQFDQVGFGIGGRTFALTTWRNQLVAGTYRSPWRDGARLEHVGRFDGVRWHALGGGLVGGHVRALLEFQGDLIAAGSFQGSPGVAAPGVARWNGTQWQPLGAGLDGEVFALCVHQGQLYAAGDFQSSGATPIRCVARWTGSQWVEVAGGVRDSVSFFTTARALASNGVDLFVGGDFDRAGSVGANKVAAFDGTAWRPLGSGVQGTWVWTLAWYAGRLFAGGAFTTAGGVTADSLAAWNGAQWQAIGIATPGQLNGSYVYALASWNGDLWIGGNFTPPGGGSERCIARYDGAQLHALPAGLALPETGSGTFVFALQAWNGKLHAGGEFQIAGSLLQPPQQAVVVNHIAAFDGATWQAVGKGLGADGVVHALGRYQGMPIAAGEFTTIGGALGVGLARFDGERWLAMGDFDNRVLDVCEHNGELWVAGEFFRVDGIIADGVARFDGAHWHAVGGGPGASRAYSIRSYQGTIHIGTAGGPKRWTGTAWQTFTPTITGTMEVLHEHQGVLYMGNSVGTTTGPFLYAWNGSTLTPIPGLNGSVEALASWGGELLVGGRFTQAGGQPARAIARWNGSTWSSFGSGIAAATVKAIADFRGQLVIGGDFNSIQGAPAEHVARWTGTSWVPLTNAAQPDGVVYALLPDDARGELLVGGWFFQIGGMDSPYLAAFEPNAFWSAAGSPLAGTAFAPALTGEGRLHPGTPVRWHLSSAAPGSLAVFVLGHLSQPTPLFGGTLVPTLDAIGLLPTDAVGMASLELVWPTGLMGFSVWSQVWTVDAGAPQGFSATRALQLRGP